MDPQLAAGAMVGKARELLDLVDQAQQIDPDDVGCLAELVLSVASWLRKGGFAPDWSQIEDFGA